MGVFQRRLIDVAFRPYHYMTVIIGIIVLVGGLYIAGPFYQPSSGGTQSAVAASVSTYIGRAIFGLLYGVPGILLLFGTYRDKTKLIDIGLYWCALVIFFTVILVLVVNGFRPIYWLAYLCLSLFSAILWLRNRWMR